MISLSPVGSAGSAASYYSADNYYTADEARDASAWMGSGAAELGLGGEVDEATFTALLEGRLPNGSQIAAQNGVHRPGLDLTFSISKSASLLAMLGGDQRIVEALRQSVVATLGWVERNVIEARVWDAAQERQVPEKTGNLIAATFTHDVNRNQEPQLHIHAVLANATKASDGKWHAVRNDGLYKAQHLISAIQNADFRARIEELGYETVPARNPIDGAFEIKGVSRETIDAFSTRSAEIRAALEAGQYSSARAREIATLATRKAKDHDIDPAERMANWRETALGVDLDAPALVSAALARAERQQTVWSRLTEGLRGVAERGLAIAGAMGITPRDGDPLVPERSGRLSPAAFAAAQAVASAARELGEHEAAFSRFELMRTALERQGPFRVEQIEARIEQLVGKGLLIAGDKLITTEKAVALEAHVIAAARAGVGRAVPITRGSDVAARLQASARELGLRRLNEGQERAGVAILTSSDRVHLVQGGAGVGKSAALAPVAAIARAEGLNVIALSHVGRIAREFGEKTHSPASTVDAFLGKYARVMDGSASSERVAEARGALTGALVMVDEASQLGSHRLARLVDLANAMEVGHLVLAGDIKQLPAIEAGKPFAQLQGEGLATSQVTENLRARSEQMIALNQALAVGDVETAFAVLAPQTTEVASGRVAETAARRWAALPSAERDQTLLLAAGRAMRAEGNAVAQAELLRRSELGARSLDLLVLDRVSVTREGSRQITGYREGRIVEFRTDLPSQGFARGEMARVHDSDGQRVELVMPDGELRAFIPDRLPRNLTADAVTIYQEKPITVHEGDRIRWTQRDGPRDLYNGDIAHIARIDTDAVIVTKADGGELRLSHDDPMLARLDLAYAINVHVAQGTTATNGIIMMSEHERRLNTAESFLVAVTRIAENASLIADNPAIIERSVANNPGGKTEALSVAQEVARQKLPEPEVMIERTRDFEIGM